MTSCHFSLSFPREMRARNVTCIPMEKARRNLNASDAVFLPLLRTTSKFTQSIQTLDWMLGNVYSDWAYSDESPLFHLATRQGRAQRGAGPPWDLKNTIFSGFLPLNYVICIFEVSFF